MASSSKTTLCGPPLLLTHVTESPLQILTSSGTKTSWPASVPILTVLVPAAKPGAATCEEEKRGAQEEGR